MTRDLLWGIVCVMLLAWSYITTWLHLPALAILSLVTACWIYRWILAPPFRIVIGDIRDHEEKR